MQRASRRIWRLLEDTARSQQDQAEDLASMLNNLLELGLVEAA
jgi:hypothetical protein